MRRLAGRVEAVRAKTGAVQRQGARRGTARDFNPDLELARGQHELIAFAASPGKAFLDTRLK